MSDDMVLSLADCGLLVSLLRPHLPELLSHSVDENLINNIWNKIIHDFYEMRTGCEEMDQNWENLFREFKDRTALHCDYDGEISHQSESTINEIDH